MVWKVEWIIVLEFIVGEFRLFLGLGVGLKVCECDVFMGVLGVERIGG